MGFSLVVDDVLWSRLGLLTASAEDLALREVARLTWASRVSRSV